MSVPSNLLGRCPSSEERERVVETRTHSYTVGCTDEDELELRRKRRRIRG